MSSLTRAKKERRQAMRDFIASYLEQRTYWGKFMARPSQVRAAAKKMQMCRRIPYEVAKALGAIA
jgi:hypothetical protein